MGYAEANWISTNPADGNNYLGFGEITTGDLSQQPNYYMYYNSTVSNTTHYDGVFGYVQTLDPRLDLAYTKPSEDVTFDPNGSNHGSNDPSNPATQYLDMFTGDSQFYYGYVYWTVSKGANNVAIPPPGGTTITDAPAVNARFLLSDNTTLLTYLSKDADFQSHLVFQNQQTGSTGGIPISISTATWTWSASATNPTGGSTLANWSPPTITPLPATIPGDNKNSLMAWAAPFDKDPIYLLWNDRSGGQA